MVRAWLLLVCGALLVGSRATAQAPWEKITVGKVTQFDLAWAKVPYSDVQSEGWGLGGGLGVQVPLSIARVFGELNYRRVSLGRTIDPGGPVVTPDPTPVVQALGYLTLALGAGVRLGTERGEGDAAYWLEGGMEYWHPVSASQAVRDAEPEAFDNGFRPLMALAGFSASFALDDRWVLELRAQGLYNLVAASGTGFWGLRLGLALNVAL